MRRESGPRIDRAAELIQTLRNRIITAEEQTVALTSVALRLIIVDSVADLPANASPREWFRVRTGTIAERSVIYVGNGPTAPLTKITPTAL